MGDVYEALLIEISFLTVVAIATAMAIAAVRRRRRPVAGHAADESPAAESESKAHLARAQASERRAA